MIHNADKNTLFQRRISNKQLCNALDNAHKGILSANWTKQSFTAYLKANGINEKTIATAYEHAENCRLIDVYGHARESNDNVKFII